MQEINERRHITEEMWISLEQDTVSREAFMQILEHTGECTWCADRLAAVLERSDTENTGTFAALPPSYLSEQILERTRQPVSYTHLHIVYRRSEEELPARVEEVHHAKEEGIIFDLLTNPKEILVDENGWVKGMTCVKMELGEPDASGRRRPVEIKGSEFDLELDTVIMSLGTSPNPLISSTTEGLDVNKWQCIVADENNGKTTKEGVYAGGDAVTGAATVILAMGAGKAAAKGIDEYLSRK